MCQAGILAAALTGIDLRDSMNTESDFQLTREKKDSVSSRETGPLTTSMTPGPYHRRMQSNGNLRPSNSVDIYGTYRRKRDHEDINSSRQYLDNSSLADYFADHAYSEQNTIHLREDDLYSNRPPVQQIFQRHNSVDNYLNEESRTVSKSSSPVRRISAVTDADRAQYEKKTQRPKTLNITPEHSVVQTPNIQPSRFDLSKSSITLSSTSHYQNSQYALPHPAFTSSNTSSSSQSPASTPSPKLINKIPQTNTVDSNVDNNRTRQPIRQQQPIYQNYSPQVPNATRPRPLPQNYNSQSNTRHTNTSNTTTKHIAFI